jgi:hypothetical protein
MLVWYCNFRQRLLMERRDGLVLAMPEAKGPHRVSLLTSDRYANPTPSPSSGVYYVLLILLGSIQDG